MSLSADRIHAEWQTLGVGDVLRSRPDRPGMRVELLEPERVLSNRSETGDWEWTFALEEQPDGSTRLLSRNRIAMKGTSAGQRFGMLVMEPGSLVMKRTDPAGREPLSGRFRRAGWASRLARPRELTRRDASL